MTRYPCPYLGGEVELSDEREQHIAEHHPDLLPDHMSTLPCFTRRKTKPIRDEINRVLAVHYGFTDEELDFPSIKLGVGIPSARLRAGNYDIKYRMGRDTESKEE